MNDKDEILASIAGLGTRLETRLDGLETRLDGLETCLDVMANGIGRIETDVAQVRVDVASYHMQSNARLTVLEEKIA